MSRLEKAVNTMRHWAFLPVLMIVVGVVGIIILFIMA